MYDEAETHGPFATLDEAEEWLGLEEHPEGMARYARFP